MSTYRSIIAAVLALPILAASGLMAPWIAVPGLTGIAAAAPKLRLCTARKDGLYYFAGERIAKIAEGTGVDVEVVETAGSLFNMSALKARLCDAAIAQADAVLRFEQIYGRRGVKLTEPVALHREYLHLVCRRDSDIKQVGDLVSKGAQAKILVGEPGSGSTVTWTVITEIEKTYGKARTQMIGRALAIDTLTDGKADCLVFVAGVGTGFMEAVTKSGGGLHLVTIDDDTLVSSKVLGLSTFRFDTIPPDAYGSLQVGTDGTKTVSVQALAVTTSRWADRNPNAYAAFLAAVEESRPAILERAGQSESP